MRYSNRLLVFELQDSKEYWRRSMTEWITAIMYTYQNRVCLVQSYSSHHDDCCFRSSPSVIELWLLILAFQYFILTLLVLLGFGNSSGAAGSFRCYIYDIHYNIIRIRIISKIKSPIIQTTACWVQFNLRLSVWTFQLEGLELRYGRMFKQTTRSNEWVKKRDQIDPWIEGRDR